MKILTILGARPQFIKSAPVSRALAAAGHTEVMLHTGQHYDARMSAVFFDELKLVEPTYNLEVGSGSRMTQLSLGLSKLEPILEAEQPDIVMVYGDTNATLTGALGAVAFHIPLAHVEAGLRSFNRQMPEETNRILTDQVSRWCFAPTETALNHLKTEGLGAQAFLVGDVMLDAVDLFQPLANQQANALLECFSLKPQQYALLTLHRAETTAQPQAMQAVLQQIDQLGMPVIFPVHPRTKPLVETMGPFQHIRLVEPLSYVEMLAILGQARLMLTDSGGVQKEAAILGVPCVTLRTETEWVETVELGANRVVGLDPAKLATGITDALATKIDTDAVRTHYGNGYASHRIAEQLSL